jgi:hypothetical protein
MPTDETNYEELLFQDPTKALALYGEKIKKELREEYQQNQGRTLFWNGFYERNPDLKPDHDIATAVLQEMLQDPSMAQKPASEAAAILADRTRERIEELRSRREVERESAVFVGGPGLDGRSPMSMPAASGPTETLGSIIKARAERRREWLRKPRKAEAV